MKMCCIFYIKWSSPSANICCTWITKSILEVMLVREVKICDLQNRKYIRYLFIPGLLNDTCHVVW
jgi:hypothetical protein